MNQRLRHLAFGALGLAGGFLLGRYFADAPVASEKPRIAAASASGHPAIHEVPVPASKKHTLASLRLLRNRGMASTEFSKQLEHLDAPSLKALLADALSKKPELDELDSANLSYLIQLAGQALFRLEGAGALEWADHLTAQQGRFQALSALISGAAHEDPVLVKPWIERFRDEFGKTAADSFVDQLVIGATGRSATDLIKIRQMYGEDIKGVMFPQGDYAPDFDSES